MRVKRRSGVSAVIAELLLIVITVAIGTLVYSFASSAFGGFGAGFSNLVQGAGNQLAENVVVEQTYFLNFNGTASCPVTNTCGDLYIRNVGSNTATVTSIFLTNVTANAPVPPGATPPCPGGPFPIAGVVCFDTWGGASYNLQLPLTIAPGSSTMIRFNVCSFSKVGPGCFPVYSGTTYAFTLVTQRGNQFVAYEKR